MSGRVLPNLEVLRVAALPAPASDYVGQFRRTTAGLFWSDGADWMGPMGSDVADPISVDPWLYKTLPADVAVSTTTLGDVTGMFFVALPNTTYEVEVFGAYQAQATTTGLGVAWNIPSGSVIGQMVANSTAVAVVGTQQIADDAVTGATAGVATAATNTPFSFKATIAVGGTGGNVQLRLRSEIATSNITMKANLTVMKWRKATDGGAIQRKIIPITSAGYAALVTKDPTALYVEVTAVQTDPSYKWMALTAAEYAAIGTKDPEVLYVVED